MNMHGTNAEAMRSIIRGDHGDPFSVLGMHEDGPGGALAVRVFFPDAEAVTVLDRKTGKRVCALDRLHQVGFFAGTLARRKKRFPYQLAIVLPDREITYEDPYRFYKILPDKDAQLLADGIHWRAYDVMGAHFRRIEGVEGVSFTVWAPNASRVSVVGDFNNWDGRRHVMRLRYSASIWEIFIPGLTVGDTYMFEIKDAQGNLLPLKVDPFAFGSGRPPETVSVVQKIDNYKWADKVWMNKREKVNAPDAPVSVYEVHLGSWRRVPEEGNRQLTYEELGDYLIPYVKNMGFTHIQLMPVAEFPFEGSWGYQPVSLFAPTRRQGTPEEFKRFVERCHQANIGVFLDWVPAHFPGDAHGLARFDGTCLYEHADPRKGYHPDWSTLIYNYGRYEVANFLISNALFWLDRYHIDGLRVDAVASMLYLDYSRKEGEWVPNAQGGNTNLEAIDFLQRMNELAHGDYRGAVTIAEESTSWPGVTQPTRDGGLGFTYKWNMGWMHDTLEYMKLDPFFRKYHHHKMTFGMVYAYSENFILPLSHDEVVHMKGSLLGRMQGDTWRRFANLRAYYGFMWTHPGKKLLFMGGEFAQEREWNHDASLDWHLLQTHWHEGIQRLVRDLNQLYRSSPALYTLDNQDEGFRWVKVDAEDLSLYAYLRMGSGQSKTLFVVCNFTPVPRYQVRLGVPEPGLWRERLNTDATEYSGSGLGNDDGVHAEEASLDGFPYTLSLTLPPLSTIILERESA